MSRAAHARDARCLWEGGAALDLAVRVRRAALVLVCPLPTKGRCAGERPLLRRATAVRHASCDLQHQASAACHAAKARQRSLSLGRRGAALELASSARRAVMVVEGSRLVEVRRSGERTLFSDATPWCDVPAAASNSKPEPRVLRGTSASALAVSGRKRSIRACFACAWCRDGRDRFVSRRKVSHRREAALFGRTVVV